MVLEPARRKAHFQRMAADTELDGGQRRGAAAAMQQHREPQQHDQEDRQAVPGRNQVFDADQHQLAAMRADQVREQQLLLARETRQVGVLQQVRAVAVITAVRHVQADFVQARGPFQNQLGLLVGDFPTLGHLREEP